MTLNTYVAGEGNSLRELSAALHDYAEGAYEGATGYHRTRSDTEAVWEGQACDAYRTIATREGQGGDALADLGHGLVSAVDGLAADLDTVKAKMGHAHQAAYDGELAVLGNLIFPPSPPLAPMPTAPDGGILSDLLGPTPGDQAHQQVAAQHAQQQAAYEEAQAIVHEARQIERAAHERLHAALNTHGNALDGLSQQAGWEHAAASATSPTAVALAGAATRMDGWASNATLATFEKAMAGGPTAAAGAWRSMTTAQRGDMMAQFPRMVGNTSGVPAIDRDRANRSRLSGQRAALVQQVRDSEAAYRSTRSIPGARAQEHQAQADKARASLGQLDALEEQLNKEDKYLLGLDSTVNGRGRVIVANGNPDTAHHVLTYVPGTSSDLSNSLGDVQRNDQVLQRAHEIAPDEKTATIMWGDYESPPFLDGHVPHESYAQEGSQDLSHFQEGLRATHDGPPSHNTILGHSYGTTTVGYAARDHGVHADDIAFFGSPGVGVEHAQDLGVRPDHVWAGTSEEDSIHGAVSPNPLDWGNGKDDHWFGLNPNDPAFGGNVIPTDPSTGHSEYWDKPQSLDGIARITTGQAGSRP